MILDGGTKIIIVQALALCVVSGALYKSCERPRTGAAIPSRDAIVSRHTITPAAPLRALGKPELQAQGVIGKDLVKNADKEVLATGTITDDSGTRHVAAVLDVKTGGSSLIEKRPFWELMSRNEIGLGIGFTGGGLTKQAFYRNTFARVGDFYGSVLIEAHEQNMSGAGWAAMAQVSYRW